VLGRYDYDVPFHEWDSGRKAPRVSSYLFEHSAHFPMIEEPDLFDKKLIGWLKAQR
jgi:proline iminopeptidase